MATNVFWEGECKIWFIKWHKHAGKIYSLLLKSVSQRLYHWTRWWTGSCSATICIRRSMKLQVYCFFYFKIMMFKENCSVPQWSFFFFFFCGTCDSSRIKLISLIAEAMTLYNISEYVCVAGQTGWKCVQPWARWYILSAGQRTERITET